MKSAFQKPSKTVSSVFWLTNHYDAGNVYPDVAPLFTGFGRS